jgi:hypothetical protein
MKKNKKYTRMQRTLKTIHQFVCNITALQRQRHILPFGTVTKIPGISVFEKYNYLIFAVTVFL